MTDFREPNIFKIKTYTKKSYSELLKRKKSQQPFNQFLLMQYSFIQYSVLLWETRDQYFELIEKFFNREIHFFDFCSESEKMGEILDEICKKLEDNFVILSPLEKAVDFCNLIEEIYDLCESMDPDSQLVFTDNNETDPARKFEPSAEFQEELKTLYHKAKNFADMNS